MEYAAYKGDEFLCVGSLQEIAQYTNKTIDHIRWLKSPSAQKRNDKTNKILIIEIEEYEDE